MPKKEIPRILKKRIKRPAYFHLKRLFIEQDKTVKEIAESYGVCARTVYRWFDFYGLPLSKPRKDYIGISVRITDGPYAGQTGEIVRWMDTLCVIRIEGIGNIFAEQKWICRSAKAICQDRGVIQ